LNGLNVLLILALAQTSFAADLLPSNPAITRVTGRVSVAGDVQRPKPLKVFKNQEICGSTVPNETILTSRDGGLRNAVVIFRPLDRAATAPAGRIVLDNKNCAFVPHIQVGVVGSELVLKNSDPILHTVHARMGKETLFNVGLPRWREVTKMLARPGVVRIDCDVLHTWMSAVIVVTASPYYSITDEAGRFIIDALPVGDYEVEILHEKLGTKSQKVSVSNRLDRSLDVVYALRTK
jgi:hypothetical protein